MPPDLLCCRLAGAPVPRAAIIFALALLAAASLSAQPAYSRTTISAPHERGSDPSTAKADVSIAVRPVWMDDESAPTSGRFLWSYEVTFTNNREDAIRVLRREWVTSDATGDIQRHAGEGVLGQQPIIEPGASYTYQSWMRLPTPTGTMIGRFWFHDAQGKEFSGQTPVMTLRMP
jgi:ApaG protein